MKEVLEIGALIVINGLCLFIVLFNRWKSGSEHSRRIGKHAVQYIALNLIVPTVFILALEGTITGQETAVLLGTIAGFYTIFR